jgi:hypothetical protein
MSDAHKRALAQGREESRVVRAYLEALETQGPRKRGRKRSESDVRKRLSEVDRELAEARSINRLKLLQERADLVKEIDELTGAGGPDIEELRAGFISAAKTYGERKSISYETWREFGVDAATLRAAGITRSS